MKLFKMILVLALVFAMSAIAYAETQAVKVSGDITERAFARGNYDLSKNDADTSNGAVVGSGQSTNWASYLTSTVEVQVDADLTDNVSGVIRLVNQKVWGDSFYSSQANGELGRIDDIRDVIVADQTRPGQGGAYDVEVDLAYIELKEFLYSPLTLKIGRQDLWFGKGFIIGANLGQGMDTIYPAEYSAVRSFDAIRATLDYDPWTIDAVFAKMSENLRRADDDINLYGINVGYVFDNYNAEAEAYWFMRQDRNPAVGIAGAGTTVMTTPSLGNDINNDVHTFGLRGSFDPIEDWTVALEGAYQGGEFLGIASQLDNRNRQAFAIDAAIECRYWQDDFAWRPVVGLEYIIYSGDSNSGGRTAAANGDYEGWDQMYRGKFDTAIREFQNVFYRTAQVSSPSVTNQHQLLVTASVEPTDSLTVDLTYANFWLVRAFADDNSVVAQNTDKYIGSEVDVNLTWDYTEDVTFGLLAAWFIPGDHFTSANDDVATDLVGSVALSF